MNLEHLLHRGVWRAPPYATVALMKGDLPVGVYCFHCLDYDELRAGVMLRVCQEPDVTFGRADLLRQYHAIITAHQGTFWLGYSRHDLGFVSIQCPKHHIPIPSATPT